MAIGQRSYEELVKTIKAMELRKPIPKVLRAPEHVIAGLPDPSNHTQLREWMEENTVGRHENYVRNFRDFFDLLIRMDRGDVIHAESFIQSKLRSSHVALARAFRAQTGLITTRTFPELAFDRDQTRLLAPFQTGLSKRKGLWVIL